MGSQSTSHVRGSGEINGRHALCIIVWMEIASSLLYHADCIIRPMTANPFHYGTPVQGHQFVGRETEVDAIVGRVRDHINVVLLCCADTARRRSCTEPSVCSDRSSRHSCM